jgi:hypothetical protein
VCVARAANIRSKSPPRLGDPISEPNEEVSGHHTKSQGEASMERWLGEEKKDSSASPYSSFPTTL